MVPEIPSATDIIFYHFGPFFALLPPNNPKTQNFEKNEKSPGGIIILYMCNNKWQSYGVWFLRYRAQRTEFFVILDHFLHFYSPNNPKTQNFEKIKLTYYHFTNV